MRVITACITLAITAAVILSTAFGTAANAAEPVLTNPTASIEFLTLANVSEILTELGAQSVQAQDEDKKNKRITFKNGDIPFNVVLFACDIVPNGCLGMVMLVGLDPGVTNYPLESFNAFNRDNFFVTAVKLDGNKYGVSRMLITEGGVSKKNIAVNVSNFVAVPLELMKFLDSQIVAGLEQGSPQFLKTSSDAARLRPVELSLVEIKRIVDTIKLPNATGLKKR